VRATMRAAGCRRRRARRCAWPCGRRPTAEATRSAAFAPAVAVAQLSRACRAAPPLLLRWGAGVVVELQVRDLGAKRVVLPTPFREQLATVQIELATGLSARRGRPAGQGPQCRAAAAAGSSGCSILPERAGAELGGDRRELVRRDLLEPRVQVLSTAGKRRLRLARHPLVKPHAAWRAAGRGPKRKTARTRPKARLAGQHTQQVTSGQQPAFVVSQVSNVSYLLKLTLVSPQN
jgi:hypothetical protein